MPLWGASLLLAPHTKHRLLIHYCSAREPQHIIGFSIKGMKESVPIVIFLGRSFSYLFYPSGSSLCLINASCYNFSLLPVWPQFADSTTPLHQTLRNKWAFLNTCNLGFVLYTTEYPFSFQGPGATQAQQGPVGGTDPSVAWGASGHAQVSLT